MLVALDYHIPAGILALVVALQPLATAAFSGLITGERTNIYQWMGVVLGFLGVVFTVSFRMDFGYLILFGSVIAITAASLIQRLIEVTKGTNKLPLNLTLFYQSFATTLALALRISLILEWKYQILFYDKHH